VLTVEVMPDEEIRIVGLDESRELVKHPTLIQAEGDAVVSRLDLFLEVEGES